MLNIFNKYNTTILFSIFAFFISACGNEYSTKLPDENYKCEIQNPEYKFLEETPCICNKNCALKAFNDLIIGEDGYIAKWEGDEPVEIRIVGKNMEEDFYEVKSLIEKPVKILNTATPFDLRIVYDPEADQNIYQRSILIFYVDDIEDAIRNDFPILDKIERKKILNRYLKEKKNLNLFTLKVGSTSSPYILNIMFVKKNITSAIYLKQNLNKIAALLGSDKNISSKNTFSDFANNDILLTFLIYTLYQKEIYSGEQYKDVKPLFEQIYMNEKSLAKFITKMISSENRK